MADDFGSSALDAGADAGSRADWDPAVFEPSDAQFRTGLDSGASVSGADLELRATEPGSTAQDFELTERRRPRGNVSRIVGGLALGLLIGAVGTAIHRTIASGVPIGLVLGLVLTMAAALLLRAWGGVPALLSYALGWVISMEALSLYGPGGDIIVLDPSANVPIPQAGIIWNYLGIALLVTAFLLPKRWFQRIDEDDDEMALTTEFPG